MIDEQEVGKIDRGARAERILKDALYIEAFDKVRLAILASIESRPARDTEGREHLYQRLKALNDVKGAMEQVMNDGRVELHLREEKRRFKIFR